MNIVLHLIQVLHAEKISNQAVFKFHSNKKHKDHSLQICLQRVLRHFLIFKSVYFFSAKRTGYVTAGVCAFIIMSLVPLPGMADPSLPVDLTENALAAIDMIYKENFEQAEEEIKKIVKKYPDHPAGYFFTAVVIDSWMALYQSKSRENEFYQYCDQAIVKGETMLDRNRNDEWAKFFIAGANGYKGTYEARYEHWITAFRYGWQGVSKMNDLESVKSKIVDINYGIGCYDYWRGAMIKTLWFMPNVDDRRQRGIDRLYYTLKEGVFTKVTGAVALIEILLNENRNEDVLPIANEMLKEYPNSQVFNIGKAKALYGIKQYNESIILFEKLYEKCKEYNEGDHFMVILCHLWLAKNYLMLNNYTQALVECNRMTYYRVSSNTRKLLEKQFNEADNIKKKVYAMQGK